MENIEIKFLWYVPPHSLIDRYERIVHTGRFHLQNTTEKEEKEDKKINCNIHVIQKRNFISLISLISKQIKTRLMRSP